MKNPVAGRLRDARGEQTIWTFDANGTRLVPDLEMLSLRQGLVLRDAFAPIATYAASQVALGAPFCDWWSRVHGALAVEVLAGPAALARVAVHRAALARGQERAPGPRGHLPRHGALLRGARHARSSYSPELTPSAQRGVERTPTAAKSGSGISCASAGRIRSTHPTACV